MDSSQRVESLVDELYKVTRFDTLFILPPYTSKDSIQHYLNCYHKNSDLISHDDEFNLIVIRKAEILEYIYLKRGGCTFGEISRWYGSHLQVEKD